MSDLEKSKVRLKIRKELDEIDEYQHHSKSLGVCKSILEIPEVQDASCVMAYLAQHPELNIDSLIKALLARGVNIAVPHVGEHGHEMHPIELGSLDKSELDVDRFGIRTPSIHKNVSLKSIDVIVVPGVAFGKNGTRLGRGGGFYDRFLNSISDRTLRIGACFDLQNQLTVPTDSHDAGVDLLVTESGTIDCKE